MSAQTGARFGPASFLVVDAFTGAKWLETPWAAKDAYMSPPIAACGRVLTARVTGQFGSKAPLVIDAYRVGGA